MSNHPTLRSGIVTLEWNGSCYSYQDSKSRLVNIQKIKSGWISSWINPGDDAKGPFILPSVGTYKTLRDAFYSSLSLFCK